MPGTAAELDADRAGAPSGAAALDAAPAPAFVERVPIDFARAHQVLGLEGEGPALRLAMADPEDAPLQDVLRRWLGRPLLPEAAEAGALREAIDAAYGERSGAAESFAEALDRESVMGELERLEGREDLLSGGDRAPIVKLVNLVLFEALKQEASDVHLQPREARTLVRLRIDGVLFDALHLPAGAHEEVASRIKIMAGMDIAEKRLPQDGRATVRIGERDIDLRVSSVPARHGERVVIRFLDKSARLFTLDELGMDAPTAARFEPLVGLEHGLILVTGPTGSGKSTTLYASLGRIDSTERNVMTLEDPIEHQLEGVSQIQVARKRGMSFASGLRSVLRQDPDILMVGEIRDQETAVLAIQAALTGHLVFSTLHTNDAASAVTRLLDLGIAPYLVASSLVGVLAQRLVRRVCPHCAEPERPEARVLEALGLDPGDPAGEPSGHVRGRGCQRCRGTGYHGRVGCFELLTVDEPVRRLIQGRATASEIGEAGRAAGMKGLAEDGARKAAAGLTTLEEVLRVSMHRRA